MTKILKPIHKAELKFAAVAVRFFSHHLFLEYFTVLIGVPLFILVAVFICSTAFVLPFALLFGWL